MIDPLVEMREKHRDVTFEEILKDVPHGLVLEFGVWQGRSLSIMANALAPRIVHGFDSFKGLPEPWPDKFPAGHFAMDYVPVVPENARLHVGLFQDTLVPFLYDINFDVNWKKMALVHIDSDIYSSAAFILKTLEGQFTKGSLLVFDEIDEPHAIEHEEKAFLEYLDRTREPWEYVGHHHACGAIFRLR